MESTAEIRRLYRTATALLALLALTIGLSFADLGRFNFIVAIVIAVAKAVLVASIFMELRFSSRVLLVLATGAVFWLLLLLFGTLGDVVTRV